MADTRVQHKVEDWVRDNWMRNHFGQEFYCTDLKLSPGGKFEFDAVSADKSIAASISTSSEKTSGGKFGTGKFMKLRSDMLFLLMAVSPNRRFIILTEKSMFERCQKERLGGRIPKEIDFLFAEIPEILERELVAARIVASKEVTPQVIEAELPDELLLSRHGRA